MKTPLYLNLSTGAPARLASLRREFAEHATRYPHCPEAFKPKNWRDVRTSGFHNWEANYGTLSQGSNGKTPVWYCHAGKQFRGECFADEVEDSPIDHRGWYSDEECCEKVRGIVARLPHGRFISGYEWSSNGERVYFAEVFDDIREAAHNADSEAEFFAEQCREDDAKFREAQRLEDESETALRRLRECLALRHAACMAYVRDEIAELIETIRANRERLKTEFAGVL